jgi:hypothetical protein
MLCILEDIGWLTIGSVWYWLGPRVEMQKVGGNGEHMGWSGVWVEVVDEVGNGTLAGSSYIGDGGYTADAGIGTGADAGAGARGIGGGWKRKFEGPGS